MARNVLVMVGDLKQLSEFSAGADAIIALDLLRMNRGLQINYETRVVTFKAASEGDPARPQKPQAFIARLPVQGQTMLLVVDTGHLGMLLYTDRLRHHLPQLKLTDRI
ncbi:MAG TPA: hypothetical protein VK466_05245, partial [Terriglobales bacterium]|nr:hypothetical protein [Terriglobales bacterium]